MIKDDHLLSQQVAIMGLWEHKKSKTQLAPKGAINKISPEKQLSKERIAIATLASNPDLQLLITVTGGKTIFIHHIFKII